MHNLTTLIQTMGLFILIPILLIVVGIGSLLTIVWRLLTGGPRDLTRPGSPYLYDRLYYLIWLAALIAWAGALLSFAGLTAGETEAWGFMLCWAIGAIGIGTLYFLRGDMMIKGVRYLADNGFWLIRWYNRMHARQLDRQSPFVRKLIPFVFLIAGTVALVVCIPHITEALAQMQAGALTIVRFVTTP